jgi:hypothetical protein
MLARKLGVGKQALALGHCERMGSRRARERRDQVSAEAAPVGGARPSEARITGIFRNLSFGESETNPNRISVMEVVPKSFRRVRPRPKQALYPFQCEPTEPSLGD